MGSFRRKILRKQGIYGDEMQKVLGMKLKFPEVVKNQIEQHEKKVINQTLKQKIQNLITFGKGANKTS